MIAKEMGDGRKGEGESDRGEKDVNTEVLKEKHEEKTNKASVTQKKATIFEKGKHIKDDEDEFSHGLVDLSTLSPIQALKLATLMQNKASEDLFTFAFEEKEVISLATIVLEKILPNLTQDSSDTPEKLRGMLNKVELDFVSLEKLVDTKVLNKFNEMRLEIFFKTIEVDREVLKSVIKIIEDALDEGG